MLPIEKRINYQILGNDTSPKLVFLHGIMGQGRNWLSIAKKFSKDFQCLIFDQRGHGKSHHPDQGFHKQLSGEFGLDRLSRYAGQPIEIGTRVRTPIRQLGTV